MYEYYYLPNNKTLLLTEVDLIVSIPAGSLPATVLHTLSAYTSEVSRYSVPKPPVTIKS